MALVEGTVDKTSLIVGDWSEIAIEYPPQSDTWLFVGNAPEGVLEIGIELYEHKSTAFPRTTDLIVPVSNSMKFTAQLEEIHAENLKLLLGQNPVDSNAYVYIGALATPSFFKFRAKRKRNSDAAEITAVFWKAMSVGNMTLGGGDEAVSSPLEVTALDDASGDYGGSTTAPLGYINLPPKA